MRIISNNHYTFTSFYLWPLIFKCSPTGSLIFCLYGRTVVVDSFVEVTCFPHALFKANLATDEIDAVVCATRHVPKYLVGATRDGAFKTVRACTKGNWHQNMFLNLHLYTTLVAPTASISLVTKSDYIFGVAVIWKYTDIKKNAAGLMLCLHKRHLTSEQVSKPPQGNWLTYLWLIV